MAKVRDFVIDKLYRGTDPFVGFPKNIYDKDIQGWQSNHPYLTDSIESLNPRIIVEIGVWKGGSTITMASKLRDLGMDAIVISIDTWLGSWDHWNNDEWFSHLGFDHGYPTIQRKFMNNIINAGVEEYVVPLPLDSLNAAHVLNDFDIKADIIHLDAGHDFDAVTADLNAWWPLLSDGGLFIGDDYFPGEAWEGVERGFNTFFGQRSLVPFEFLVGKCRIFKKNSSDE